jgi:hypothetical protein
VLYFVGSSVSSVFLSVETVRMVIVKGGRLLVITEIDIGGGCSLGGPVIAGSRIGDLEDLPLM